MGWAFRGDHMPESTFRPLLICCPLIIYTFIASLHKTAYILLIWWGKRCKEGFCSRYSGEGIVEWTHWIILAMEDIGGGASYAEGSFQSIVNVLTVRYTRIQYQALLLTRIQVYKDTILSIAFNKDTKLQGCNIKPCF